MIFQQSLMISIIRTFGSATIRIMKLYITEHGRIFSKENRDLPGFSSSGRFPVYSATVLDTVQTFAHTRTPTHAHSCSTKFRTSIPITTNINIGQLLNNCRYDLNCKLLPRRCKHSKLATIHKNDCTNLLVKRIRTMLRRSSLTYIITDRFNAIVYYRNPINR